MPNDANVVAALDDFIAAAADALGPDLRSVVLYGSAAEGRLRPTSDVNVIVVLRAFDPLRLERLREPLNAAAARVGMAAMILLEGEIADAADAFASKFADIARRRRVLHGDDPFAGLVVRRHALARQLAQVLLNLVLRLRQSWLVRGIHEEQLARLMAESAGPLRACAANLLDLEGRPAPSPREALARVAADFPEIGGDLMAEISQARELKFLPPGTGGPAVLRLIALAERMRARANGAWRDAEGA